ncbi:hypothetical protein HKX48_002307, partial [Thoreauomyces humboldtii]
MSLKLRSVKYLKINWFGCDNVIKTGAQDHVLNNLLPDQYPVLSQTKKHGRLWAAVSAEEFLRILKTNHGLYEILPAEWPRKVYFDIDKTTLTLIEVKEIISAMLPAAEFHVSGRDGSWHIIVGNYYAKNLEAMLPIKLFALENKDAGFDPIVYSKNRNFKCINQSKIGQPVQEYIEGSDSIADHLILHNLNLETGTDISNMTFPGLQMPVAEEKGGLSVDTQIDLLHIPQRVLPVPEGFDISTALPLDILAMISNPSKGQPGWMHHNLIWQIMCWAKMSGIAFTDFWQWNLQKNCTAERYKRWKKDWEACNYNISPKVPLAILQRTFPRILETRVTQVFRQQFDVPDVKTVDSDFLEAGHISGVNSKKFTALMAPMGRNKTGAVVDWLINYMTEAPQSSVLWIAPRITLAQNTLKRLQEAGSFFTNYKDVSKKDKKAGMLDKDQFLVCSIQSLHYLGKNFDIVIADEWDTIAATFGRDYATHGGNLQHNWAIWMSQLNKAKKVVIMDAFTTRLTRNILEHFRQQPVKNETATFGSMELKSVRTRRTENRVYEMVNITAPANPREFIEHADFDSWMFRILDGLASGKKLYIFTPFRGGKKGV